MAELTAKQRADRKWHEQNREKHLEAMRLYREANRESIAESQRAWRLANVERIRERNREYNAVHRDRIREKAREYREIHAERIQEMKRQYREANPDKNRQWLEANPEKAAAASRRAKHRRRSALANVRCALTADQWRQVQAFYNHRCALCKKKAKLTQDHIIPVSKGGEHTVSNILPLCKPCNSKKGVKDIAVTFQPHLLMATI
jgi:5-methylcytosine-specific restriction endonuclease McrA